MTDPDRRGAKWERSLEVSRLDACLTCAVKQGGQSGHCLPGIRCAGKAAQSSQSAPLSAGSVWGERIADRAMEPELVPALVCGYYWRAWWCVLAGGDVGVGVGEDEGEGEREGGMDEVEVEGVGGRAVVSPLRQLRQLRQECGSATLAQSACQLWASKAQRISAWEKISALVRGDGRR
ncbi:hypothetical protein E4U55_005590 [Claviceps digitariae]|nr:hypothetical protein E4U55_005590 [Claviceps digitariae]